MKRHVGSIRARVRAGLTRRAPAAFALLAALGCAFGAGAQDWSPARPVRIVVGFPPGGTSDVVGRLFAQHLGTAFGQNAIVDNRSGGGGNVGTEVLVRSPADGYTIGVIISSHASNAVLLRLSYDPVKDIQPLGLVGRAPLVLVVHPSLPAKNVQSFLALAKAKPKSINYASGGSGLAAHLVAELLKLRTGADMVHVPYRGGGPALTDVVGGQVESGFFPSATVVPLILGGRVRALAVTGALRTATLPDAPTMIESGVADFEFYEWFGIIAPAGLPAAATRRHVAEIARFQQWPEAGRRMAELGVEPEKVVTTPETFLAYLQAELKQKREIIQAAGIRTE